MGKMVTMNKRIIRGFLWITFYILLSLIPLLVMLIEPKPAGREFWREFSVALGFTGLAMMTLQFVLSARIKFLKAPYGSDIVYYFHKQISLVTFFLILAHPIILFVFDPATLNLLNFLTAPTRARAAVIATIALSALIMTSVFRKQLGIKYIPWRIAHGILATFAVAFALVHIKLVGYYLSAPWKQVLWLIYSISWIGMLFYVRVIQPALLLQKPYAVQSVNAEKGNSYSLTVKPIGHKGFKFKPGQFAWLTAWNSPFADSEHPFSFSSSATSDELVFTIKELGKFTNSIKLLKPGAKVYVDGPYGIFSIDHHPKSHGFLFIAGGIGITPMISMLRTMRDRNDQRPVRLIYAGKDIESLPFLDELKKFTEELVFEMTVVLENTPENWDGEKGFITKDIIRNYLPQKIVNDTFEVFVCGPEPMMDAVEKYLVQLGVPYGDFHSERFNFV
jgi:3-phenylpropionate/trans-cinnamate dioxygenase ferredoxin reductase subunit